MTTKKLSSSLEVECFIDSEWKFNAVESVDLTDCSNARWTLSHNGESALLENHDGFLPDALIVELVSGRAMVIKPSRRFIASCESFSEYTSLRDMIRNSLTGSIYAKLSPRIADRLESHPVLHPWERYVWNPSDPRFAERFGLSV